MRSAAKIDAAIRGARAWLDLRDAGIDFSEFLWDFTGGRPLQTCARRMADVPAETEVSRRLSRALRDRGFSFVGPVIVYAFMRDVVSWPTKQPLAKSTPPSRSKLSSTG